jgi:DNA end-binding protein Ku
MLELASHIVKTKAGHFEPSKFEDQYEDALKELLKKKQEGKPIERPAPQADKRCQPYGCPPAER